MSAERPQIKGLEINESGLDKGYQRRVERQMGWLDAMIELETPNSNLAETVRLIREGCYPVFYANHTQHANIAGLRTIYKALDLLKGKPKDMYIAIASSLVNDAEGQNEKLVRFATHATPLLEREGAHFVPLPRPKDVEELMRRAQTQWGEGGKVSIRRDPRLVQAVSDGKDNKEMIEKSVATDAGYMLFPETSTDGGVLDANGMRRGMIEVTHGMFNDLLLSSFKYARKIIFIPLGMNGFNNIVEPRTTNYSNKVKAVAIREKIADQFGVNLGQKPAEVTVGKPVTAQDLIENNIIYFENGQPKVAKRDTTNTFLMQKVADIVEPQLQGFYRRIAG